MSTPSSTLVAVRPADAAVCVLGAGLTVLDGTTSKVVATASLKNQSFDQYGELLAIADAGLPIAGTAYIAQGDTSGTGNVVPPVAVNLATGKTKVLPISGPTTSVAIAPSGTPNAGTVYFGTDRGIAVLAPNGTVSRVSNGYTDSLVVAPSGPNNAGTVFIDHITAAGTPVLGSVTPDGAPGPFVDLAVKDPKALVMAPAGTQSAGTIFVAGDDSASVIAIAPDGTTGEWHGGEHPLPPVIVPPGVNVSGDAYMVSQTLTGLIRAGGSIVTVPSISVARPVAAAVAPAGTPGAGSFYVVDVHGTITKLESDSQTASQFQVEGNVNDVSIDEIDIAPAGRADAGDLYVVEDNAVVVLTSNNKLIRKIPIEGGATGLTLKLC